MLTTTRLVGIWTTEIRCFLLWNLFPNYNCATTTCKPSTLPRSEVSKLFKLFVLLSYALCSLHLEIQVVVDVASCNVLGVSIGVFRSVLVGLDESNILVSLLLLDSLVLLFWSVSVFG